MLILPGEAKPPTTPVPPRAIGNAFAYVVALPDDVTSPVKFAFLLLVVGLRDYVVTFPAVNPEAVPVMFVPTSVDGVPRLGVTSVGEFAKTTAPVPVEEAVKANVPDVVIGLPEIFMNDGTVIATDVTVPTPPLPGVCQVGIPPTTCNI